MQHSDSYKTLESFGYLIVNEMKELFEPGSMIVIPFSESMLKDLCERNEVDYVRVVSEFKSYFKHEQRIYNPYCNLAVCVFQVMVAYKCVASGNGAYNEELSSFLNIFPSDLQLIYSSGSSPKQERLWENVKNFLKSKCDLELMIPARTYFSGRYVQYPRKQQLFSMGEYNQYEKKFEEFGLLHDQKYTYNEFAGRVFSRNSSVCTNSELKSFDKARFEEIAKKVVFYCFCNWVEREIRKRSTGSKSRTPMRTTQVKYAVQIDLEKKTFILIRNSTKLTSYNNDIQNIIDYPFAYDEIFDDWKMTKRISQGKAFGVCVRNIEIRSYSHYLQGAIHYTSNTDSSLDFFVLPATKWERIPPIWKKRESFKNRLIGGLRDSTGAWIPGLLPYILTDDKTQKNYFYLDSKRIDIKESCFDLNNITLCAGLHILKFPDETPIALRVSDSIQSITYQSGWIWDKKTGKLSSVHDEWILMGLNSSGCLLHSDDTKATYFGLNYEMEKMLSRFDKMNKINNRFAKLGG